MSRFWVTCTVCRLTQCVDDDESEVELRKDHKKCIEEKPKETFDWIK